MTTYTMTGPDGKDYSIDGPPGASQEEVRAQMQAQHSAAAAAPAEPGGVRGAIRSVAHALGAPQTGDAPTAMQALGSGAASGATLGLYTDPQAEAAHPIASAVGTGVGAIGTGAALEGGAAALAGRVAPAATSAVTSAMTLQKGQPIANLLRLSGLGAFSGGLYGGAAGAVEGAQSGNIADVATGAARGAVAGATLSAVGGPLGAGVAKGLQTGVKAFAPVSQRALSLMADRLNTPVAKLAQMFSEHTASTGHPPTLADIISARDTANLAPDIGSHQSSGAAMQGAAEANLASLPGRVQSEVEGSGKTQTPFAGVSPIAAARVAQLRLTQNDIMTKAVDPIRANPVNIPSSDADLVSNNQVRKAAKGDKEIEPKLDAIQAMHAGQTPPTDVGELTVGNIDALRQNLRKQQSFLLSNGKPGAAKQAGVAADRLTGLANQQSPEYGQALTDYGTHDRFIQSYEHAYAGKSQQDAPALGDINIFNTPEGQAGLELGARSRLSQTAGASESGALSTINQLRQNTVTKGTDALQGRATGTVTTSLGNQADTLRNAAQAETRSQRNYAALSPNGLGSAQDAAAQGVKNLTEATAATALHGGVGFKTHAIYRFLTGNGVREDTANSLVEGITNRDPAFVAALPGKLRAAGLSADAQRTILSNVSRGTGRVIGAAGAGMTHIANSSRQ